MITDVHITPALVQRYRMMAQERGGVWDYLYAAATTLSKL